jgi:hypothetical protein
MGNAVVFTPQEVLDEVNDIAVSRWPPVPDTANDPELSDPSLGLQQLQVRKPFTRVAYSLEVDRGLREAADALFRRS